MVGINDIMLEKEKAITGKSGDAVIQAMDENGRDMDKKYKEASMGKLAVSRINC